MLTLHVGPLILRVRVRVKVRVMVRVRVGSHLIYQVLTLHVVRLILIAVVNLIYFKLFLFSRQALIS